MWPWSRRREDVSAELEAASRQLRDAKHEEAAAALRQQNIARLVEHSRGVTYKLDTEIKKNGWTELLQEAWRGRA